MCGHALDAHLPSPIRRQTGDSDLRTTTAARAHLPINTRTLAPASELAVRPFSLYVLFLSEPLQHQSLSTLPTMDGHQAKIPIHTAHDGWPASKNPYPHCPRWMAIKQKSLSTLPTMDGQQAVPFGLRCQRRCDCRCDCQCRSALTTRATERVVAAERQWCADTQLAG